MLEIPSHQSTEVKSCYKYHMHLQVNFIVTLGSSLLSHHRTFQWSKRRDTTVSPLSGAWGALKHHLLLFSGGSLPLTRIS